VRRTQRAHELRGGGDPPLSFAAFVTLPTTAAAARLLIYGAIFSLLARWPWGRSLLLAHPRFFSGGAFSHSGPNDDEIAAASFAYKFVAVGHTAAEAAAVLSAPRRKGDGAAAAAATAALPPASLRAVVEVRGPEPGYDATSTIVAAVAVALLNNRATLPEQGGVRTFGQVFAHGSAAHTALLGLLADGGVRVVTVEEPRGGGGGADAAAAADGVGGSGDPARGALLNDDVATATRRHDRA